MPDGIHLLGARQRPRQKRTNSIAGLTAMANAGTCVIVVPYTL